MKKIEHNVETGEIIEVDMTEEEFAAWSERQTKSAEEFNAAREQKQALLNRLNITEEEARLLLS
jgi:hypothetical protein